jgi:hypothetical protein
MNAGDILQTVGATHERKTLRGNSDSEMATSRTPKEEAIRNPRYRNGAHGTALGAGHLYTLTFNRHGLRML